MEEEKEKEDNNDTYEIKEEEILGDKEKDSNNEMKIDEKQDLNIKKEEEESESSNVQNSFLKSMFNVLKEVTNDTKGKKTPNKNLDN